MTMTPGELLEHAERLQADIDVKRHQILSSGCTASRRAALLYQINAMSDRVDEIRALCASQAAPVPVEIIPVPATI